jgi:hypothetical protein
MQREMVRFHQEVQTVRVDTDWLGGEIGKHGDIPALFMTSDIELVGSSPTLAKIGMYQHLVV